MYAGDTHINMEYRIIINSVINHMVVNVVAVYDKEFSGNDFRVMVNNGLS